MSECGAKRQGKDLLCRAPAMQNGRCRIHGGSTPSGVAASRFKHGRYSKALPARLVERYQEALADPDLLAMNHEIALIDTRLQELVAFGETLEPEALYARWDSVVSLVEQRRKLVESERKRMVDLQQMVTAGEAVALVAQVLDVIRRHVTDREVLSAIGREFTALLARTDRPGLNPPQRS